MAPVSGMETKLSGVVLSRVTESVDAQPEDFAEGRCYGFLAFIFLFIDSRGGSHVLDRGLENVRIEISFV